MTGPLHTTLGRRFDPQHNSLNALRLVLALLVIISHAWPLGGFGPDPAIGGLGLGGWAVAGFFAISGYLITSSRMRSPFLPYMWRRFLRIFPGLWICLLVIVVVFAPIAALMHAGPDGVDAPTGIAYLLTNGLFTHAQEGIGLTLRGVPFANSWDGSLWTLRYEFACYILLGAVLSLALLRRRPGGLAVVFAACLVLTIMGFEDGIHLPATLLWTAYLGTYFFAGSLLFVYADKVRLDVATIAVAVVWLAAAIWTDHVFTAAALPLAFLVMVLGTTLPLQRVGKHNDLSYGVYIYAFPVQQLLVLAGAAKFGVWMFVVFGVVATIPFAAASWFMVERPAMKLKRLPIESLRPAALGMRPRSRTVTESQLATEAGSVSAPAPPAR